MRRLLDDAARHQGPAQTDGDAAENAFQRAEFHGVGDGMSLFALPGDGARPVGAAFAEQNQRQEDRVGVGGMDLHQFFDHQFVEAQIGMDDRPGNEGAVELVVENLLGQRAGGVGMDAQVEARVAGANRLQGAGQMQGGKGFHGADAEFAGAFADQPHGRAGLPLQHQHPPRVVEQHPSGGRQFQPASLAEKEFGAEFFLQLADAAGDVGLNRIQLARGGQDAAFFNDGLKGPEGDEFHGYISKKESCVLNKSFVQILYAVYRTVINSHGDCP
jgi:hypothetical protein